MHKKILVIDDSALMRRVISDIINECNEYEVVAIARDGLEGFERIVSNPNLYSAIILDINMPKMNGIELLKKLQQNKIEQTVIIVSTVAKDGAKETIQALEYGAFDFVTKPENYLETKSAEFKEQIRKMLDVATSTRESIERTKNCVDENDVPGTSQKSETTVKSSNSLKSKDALLNLRSRTIKNNESAYEVDPLSYRGIKKHETKLIALACSTGGPKSLQHVIPVLPADIDAGMVLVQHMPAGFTASLALRLDEMSKVSVKEAQDGDVIKKGCVYIAPGGKHMKVIREGRNHVIRLNNDPPVEGLRPCANITFESLADSAYDEITCVVLTGMGADGTEGIKKLADKKKKIHVIAQDEDTCVVYGMPKAIAKAGLTDEVVPLNQVAAAITKNVGVN